MGSWSLKARSLITHAITQRNELRQRKLYRDSDAFDFYIPWVQRVYLNKMSENKKNGNISAFYHLIPFPDVVRSIN